LLNDLRVPFLVLEPDLGAPMHALVVELPNFLDALHELGELLEHGPLIVRRADWYVDLDRSLDT